MEFTLRETTKIKFSLGPDNILRTEFLPGTSITLEDGIESTKISAEMVRFSPRPLLCDLTNAASITFECRQHLWGEQHSATYTKAALIVSSPISKIVHSLYLILHRPQKPIRVFTTIKDALNWLKEY